MRRARRLLRDFLVMCRAEHYPTSAELVLSEILTNAVRHGQVSPGPEIHTRFALTADGLLIAVSDADTACLPRRRTPGPLAESGRGLLIVDAVAVKWGYEPWLCGMGKTTWALLDPEVSGGGGFPQDVTGE